MLPQELHIARLRLDRCDFYFRFSAAQQREVMPVPRLSRVAAKRLAATARQFFAPVPFHPRGSTLFCSQ